MTTSYIVAVGSYLPERIMPNSELERMVDTNDEWIQARTGIRNRHIAAENELTSDLAVAALTNALEKACKDASWLDGIIVATTTADRIFPATATIVQQKINAGPLMAFDLNAACSGFVYGLTMADSLIQSGTLKRVAVIGADIMSKIVDWNDRSTCILFGDGAAALLLEANDRAVQLLHSHTMADGKLGHILEVPGGVAEGNMPHAKIKMNGAEVFRHAVDKMYNSALETLSKAAMSPDEVDLLIPHQANSRIIAMVAAKLGMPMSKVILTLNGHGNTSAASIPLAMDVAISEGKLKRGMKVMLCAAGAGFTWGSVLLQY